MTSETTPRSTEDEAFKAENGVYPDEIDQVQPLTPADLVVNQLDAKLERRISIPQMTGDPEHDGVIKVALAGVLEGILEEAIEKGINIVYVRGSV